MRKEILTLNSHSGSSLLCSLDSSVSLDSDHLSSVNVCRVSNLIVIFLCIQNHCLLHVFFKRDWLFKGTLLPKISTKMNPLTSFCSIRKPSSRWEKDGRLQIRLKGWRGQEGSTFYVSQNQFSIYTQTISTSQTGPIPRAKRYMFEKVLIFASFLL